MGLQFAETMSGTVEWDAEPGTRHPFRFDITAHADSIRDHLKTGRAQLRGTLSAPPVTADADAEGTIVIRPLGKRIIRYELAFTGDDGKRYLMVGQKDIRLLSLIRTFTTLPAQILDEHHRQVGTCLSYFDLRKDWWTFLRSWRPA